MRWSLAGLVLALFASIATANEDVHILFLTDCTPYSDWQAVAGAFSYKLSGQQGAITRVACCTPQEKERYDKDLLGLMPTFLAKSYTWNERLKDYYQPYNKPGAVVDYLANNDPKENWLLVIDSDMLLLKQFHPRDYNLTKGWIVSADYTYLDGVYNELWERHIPNITARNDTLAGPFGRHADQVGGYFFAHKDDMRRIAPMWLSTTEEIRGDPEAWRLVGDSNCKKGSRCWISEMYGYVYAAAKADVWHRWEISTMHYPTTMPVGIPKLNHYGLEMNIDDYKWDKHHHFDFDVLRCPPWNTSSNPKDRKAGIFVPPPHYTQVNSRKNGTQLEYYRDLLRIETVAMLNAAFCDYHLKHCPPTKQLYDVCSEAIDLLVETQEELNRLEPQMKCVNQKDKCDEWAGWGACTQKSNYIYMKWYCQKSCGWCFYGKDARSTRNPPAETIQALQHLKAHLDTNKALGKGEDEPAGGAADVAAGGSTTGAVASKEKDKASEVLEAALGNRRVVGTGKRSDNARKIRQLMLRCSRMKLNDEQAKACGLAATNGEAWSEDGVEYDDSDPVAVAAVQRRRAIKKAHVQTQEGLVMEGDVDAPSSGHAGLLGRPSTYLGGGVLLTLVVVALRVASPKRRKVMRND